MTKEGYILEIHKKLANGIKLDGDEIRTVIAALRESSHCYQEPYYEVVYHDKYGNKETRIMNPDNSRVYDKTFFNGSHIVEDHFSVNFRRLVREGDL